MSSKGVVVEKSVRVEARGFVDPSILMVCSEAFGESIRELVRNDSTDYDVVLKGGVDHGAAETECMELEEGSHAFTSC